MTQVMLVIRCKRKSLKNTSLLNQPCWICRCHWLVPLLKQRCWGKIRQPPNRKPILAIFLFNIRSSLHALPWNIAPILMARKFKNLVLTFSQYCTNLRFIMEYFQSTANIVTKYLLIIYFYIITEFFFQKIFSEV